MPDLSTADANTLAGTELVAGTVYYLSLHTADPGTTGASECTDANYVRQAATFAAGSTGEMVTSGTHAAQSFPGMAAAQTLAGIGVWTAATLGAFKVGAAETSFSAGVGVQVQYASGAITFTVS